MKEVKLGKEILALVESISHNTTSSLWSQHSASGIWFSWISSLLKKKKKRRVFVVAVNNKSKKNHLVKNTWLEKCDKYHILPAWLWKSWDSDRAGHEFRDNKWKGV